MIELTLTAKGNVHQRESTKLEFKREFIWEKCFFQKCLRSIAGFANNQGGMLVFGVKNKPHEVLGIKAEFEEAHQDKKRLNERISDFFAPEIIWETEIRPLGNHQIGIIHVKEATKKPIICKKVGEPDILRESAIYYRYQAETKEIQYSDLYLMIEKEKEKERKLWFNLFEKTAKIGVENIGLLNLTDGIVSGKNGSFLIDETLLPKIQFIQEGNFSEAEGKPTLKLVGTVEAISRYIEVEADGKVSNKDRLKPKVVVNFVQKGLGNQTVSRNGKQYDKFNLDTHMRCWKKYQVRPDGKSDFPENVISKYCTYDDTHKDYIYTHEWVNFLIEKLSNEEEYDSLYSKNNDLH